MVLLSAIDHHCGWKVSSFSTQGYEDEPVSKLLLHVTAGEPVSLDRWCIDVEPNTSPSLPSKLSAESTEGEDIPGEPAPPLKVFNNYFSLGVDAQIALEFHEARGSNFGIKT